MSNTAILLTEARNNVAIWRAAFNTAKTAKAKRAAAEELDFWVGKVAHFASAS